ncbi:hypothetical protein P3294_07180 [Campylobacter jejuni]|uniref:hypothetical protein n=1 Tax=Campylobacter TaxID=194 RepID=UPI0002588E98|nr:MULTISPECIES: hypothetical protein [Campylobacter]EIB46810.1 hypothetical protein cje146_06947 [Campylobacter jejuni subsp. jejuni 2008-894]EID8142043.1 hypothetical protein [Campylobacter jejuni]EKQ8596804.1 hypothetical protein [Campylobacter jejuni]MCH3850124.1 hypothetical protein [Campylobacter jejuni]MCH3862879.1 hypothetical protein [Campylobacter jejuni]
MSVLKALNNSFNKDTNTTNCILNKSKELFFGTLRSIVKQIMFEKCSFQTSGR